MSPSDDIPGAATSTEATVMNGGTSPGTEDDVELCTAFKPVG